MLSKTGKISSTWGYVIWGVISVIAATMLTCPALADEVYQSKKMPPDEAIIQKAKEIKSCDQTIKSIFGKLPLHHSDDTWEVYYIFETKEKPVNINNNMRLKKLDTDIWIVECGNPLIGEMFWSVMTIKK